MTTDDRIPVSDEILVDFVYMCRWYGISSFREPELLSNHTNIIIFQLPDLSWLVVSKPLYAPLVGAGYDPVIPFIEAEWK